ncbi:hypothetical protein RAB80_018185 [Fusarium oxysporum f. sp. vasinfectum]|nr:hypothetical protein RAB80_018185 [Fusarium oxysporum f. sp. vasinfectum]
MKMQLLGLGTLLALAGAVQPGNVPDPGLLRGFVRPGFGWWTYDRIRRVVV